MELNKIKFLINSNGTYLDTILPPITANEDGRTIVQVIAPFPITDIVSVNYSIRPIQATVKGSYLVPTGKFGKDVLADDYTHFQTVADWNVFEIPINAVALEYISKYRAGLVLVSFAITQLQTPYFATNYLGLFSNTQPIPATSYNDGDYFIANEYNFTAHDIAWAKGDYAYFYNGKWNKGKSVLKASTPSIELPVDPSLKDAPQLEYDEDVALLLANDLGLLTQRVSQAETDIESAKNDINEIDGRVGVNETDIYNLESDVGNLQSDKADKTELVPIISELERLENEKVYLSLYNYDKGLQNTRDNAQENRLDTVEIDVANLENQNLLHSPTFNGTNGHLTFQRYGASPIVIDLPTEMIVTSGVYDDINNELVLNLASGGEVRIPIGNLLTDLDAHNIRFNGSGTNYLVGETEVDGAIKELDTRVKSNLESSKFINQPLKKINGLSLYDLFELNNEVDIHKLTKLAAGSGEINFTIVDDSVEIELFSAGPFASLNQINFDILGGTNYFLAGFGKVIESGLGSSVVGPVSGGQLEFIAPEFEMKSRIYNRVDDATTSFLLSPSIFNGISNGRAIFKNVVFINISALGLDYLTLAEINELYEEYISLKENQDFQFIKYMIGNSPNDKNSLVLEKFIYQPLSDLNNHSLYEIFELGKEVEIKNYHSNRYYNSGLGNIDFKENSVFYTRWNNVRHKGFLGGVSNRIQVSIPSENSDFYMNSQYNNKFSGQYIKQNDTGYIGNASLLVYGPTDDGDGSESIINIGIWDIGQFGLTNISLEDLDYYYNLFLYLKEGNKEFELVERTRKIDSRLKKIEDNVKDNISTPTTELSFQSINSDFNFIVLAQSYDKNINAVINDDGYKLAQSIDSGLTFDIGATVPGDVVKLIVFSDGVCVFATSSGKIYRALNYQSTPVVVYDGNIGFVGFSVTAYEDETKQYILAGEYAHGIVQKNLYVSKNGGLTFELLKEGDVLGTINNHWHVAIYDQYSDGVWASQGDDANTKTYYTENWGSTWEIIEGEQPTSIVAFPNRVIFGRDDPRQWPGANQWIRSEERPIKFENSLMFDKNKYRSYEYYPGSTRWISDNPNEYYLHFPAHALPTHERVYATGDGGKTWHLAYYKDISIFEISNLSGKDKCGYLFAIKLGTAELVRATPYLWSNNKKDNDRIIPVDWLP